MSLIVSQRSNKIDLSESGNYRNASQIRRNQFKEEFKDKERIKKLPKQLLMKIRTRVNLK